MVTKPGPGTEVRKAQGQRGWGRMLDGAQPQQWFQLGCETIGVRGGDGADAQVLAVKAVNLPGWQGCSALLAGSGALLGEALSAN